MQVYSDVAAYYLERLRAEDNSAAFFGLLESDSSVVPDLVALYRSESDPSIREFAIEVLWQRRDLSIIPLLGEALHDPNTAVWQQALDGLVALASPESLAVLRQAQTKQFSKQGDAQEFRQWIDEAIEQIELKLKS
ncbi:MAG TPA: HEAT repeat domain-containing protein [Pirellulales bacterium]|nr:HEAT repeat domain-containing protein [Pirellulales bacterium]